MSRSGRHRRYMAQQCHYPYDLGILCLAFGLRVCLFVFGLGFSAHMHLFTGLCTEVQAPAKAEILDSHGTGVTDSREPFDMGRRN